MSGLGSKTYSDPLALASGHPGAEQFEIFVDSGQAAVLGGGDEVCRTPRAVPTPRAPRAVRTYVCACRAGVRAAIVSGSQRRMPEVPPRPLPRRGGGGERAGSSHYSPHFAVASVHTTLCPCVHAAGVRGVWRAQDAATAEHLIARGSHLQTHSVKGNWTWCVCVAEPLAPAACRVRVTLSYRGTHSVRVPSLVPGATVDTGGDRDDFEPIQNWNTNNTVTNSTTTPTTSTEGSGGSGTSEATMVLTAEASAKPADGEASNGTAPQRLSAAAVAPCTYCRPYVRHVNSWPAVAVAVHTRARSPAPCCGATVRTRHGEEPQPRPPQRQPPSASPQLPPPPNGLPRWIRPRAAFKSLADATALERHARPAGHHPHPRSRCSECTPVRAPPLAKKKKVSRPRDPR